MKTVLILAATMILIAGCSYNRIGDLTMIANRNIDSKTDYKLIQHNVKGKASTKRGDALERALDEATESVTGGEFLKNIKIYVKDNGKKIKVEGDVWGIPPVNTNITTNVNLKIEFGIGDRVAFKNSVGKIIEARIAGINEQGALVVHKNQLGVAKKKQIHFSELTKMEK
ncbi:MAG: hypothetical protein COB85_01190 [Bacteroidetes bacterium]|nr:MAG: hypothetical protein COB85_01190 [Bacteroidota bacterium]